jgi:hypothetical protein
MPNMTLHVDDRVLKKARKVAAEHHTTLTDMVRKYIEAIAKKADIRKEMVIRELLKSFKANARKIGRRTWSREALHER